MKNPFNRNKGDDFPAVDAPFSSENLPSNYMAKNDFHYQHEVSQAQPQSIAYIITYKDYWNPHTTVSLADPNGIEIYTMDARYRKPNLTIRSTSDGKVIGTVSTHTLVHRIDMTFHDQPAVLAGKGIMSPKYSYSSPSLNGETLTWRPKGKFDDLKIVLEDEKGTPLARYIPNYMSSKRGGTLELTDRSLESHAMKEEVITFGMAVIHAKETARMCAGLSASASSGASAATA